MPHLCEFYPGICLTTEEKARKNLSQGQKTSVRVQYTYYQKVRVQYTHMKLRLTKTTTPRPSSHQRDQESPSTLRWSGRSRCHLQSRTVPYSFVVKTPRHTHRDTPADITHIVSVHRLVEPQTSCNYIRRHNNCEIWGSHSDVAEDTRLLGCYTDVLGKYPSFRRILAHESSGSRNQDVCVIVKMTALRSFKLFTGGHCVTKHFTRPDLSY